MELNIPDLEKINDKLDMLLKKLDQRITDPRHIVLDNDDLLKYLKIGRTKAAMLRNEGKIAYSKESGTGRIYYLLSDVLKYIENHRQETF